MNSEKGAVKNQSKNYEMLTCSSSNGKSALLAGMLYHENSEAGQCPNAKQTTKKSTKQDLHYFFFCGQLLLFQQTLVLMCTNTANVTRASWPNRTAIKGINPPKIISKPVSGPTFQQWNHHFTKKLCYHCLQPHRHTVGMSFRDAHPSTENNFTKFLNKTEFFTFLAQTRSPQLCRAAHTQVSLIQC